MNNLSGTGTPTGGISNTERNKTKNELIVSVFYKGKENYNSKRCVHPVLIAALFTIARTWKQPRCPSADEWIRKWWYIYTMEYYLAIKKNIF